MRIFLRPLAAALLFVLAAASSAQAGVGFQHLSIPDPGGPPIEIGVWYPTDAVGKPETVDLLTADLARDALVKGRRLPLVVMSHGRGGSYGGHLDTAVALAKAGFVAAALTHTADNFRDMSRSTAMWERPRQLKVLVDYMLADWSAHDRINPARVGAFGFSSGGFTVLTAAGAEANLHALIPHCREHPSFYDCQINPDGKGLVLDPPIPWTHDARIKAVVAAAPAIGFSFGREGLKNVRVPVQLWRAEEDSILPHPYYAEAVRLTLPRPPEAHVVPNADHFDFLAPCTPALAQANRQICQSRPGFDRAAFHRDLNRDVVAFFTKTLAP